jgi:hypothetical protein
MATTEVLTGDSVHTRNLVCVATLGPFKDAMHLQWCKFDKAYGGFRDVTKLVSTYEAVWNYSNLPLKPRTNVICHECMSFFTLGIPCQFVSVSLKSLK